MHGLIEFSTQTIPEGRVFALDTQTLIGIGIQLFNGILLATVLGFILYNPVKEFMQKRSNRIQNKITDAETMMASANELIAKYERKIQNIAQERLGILEATRLEAAEESKTILEAARKEAYALKERTLDSISADKKRLKEESRLHIIELASLLAEKYIAQNIDSETQEKLFNQTLAQLEDAQWLN